MEFPIEDLPDVLPDVLLWAYRMYQGILAEYCQLWLRSELTEAEADRLEEIYMQSESDSLLSFFIAEFDRILSQRVGLLDATSVSSYKNQQAWLREHLEQVPFEQDRLAATQQFLQEAGFYSGPLDGVWGKRSRRAAIGYRKKVQQLLQQKGLYDGDIDGELGNRSVSAVQAFQKSHNLKHDGVPGRQTFCALQD